MVYISQGLLIKPPCGIIHHVFVYPHALILLLWATVKPVQVSPLEAEDYLRCIYGLKLDALETANGGAIFGNKPAEIAAKKLGLPKIGGSDEHFLGDIGSVITTIETPGKSTKDILDAIKRGNTTITQNKMYYVSFGSTLKRDS